MHTSAAPKRVTVAVDNTSALQVAAGHAGAATASAQICRGLWQGAQSRLSTDFRHVPGHAGYTVNELADFLAGYAVRYPAAGSGAYSQFPADFTARLHAACGTLWLLPTATRTLDGLVWCCPSTLPGTDPAPAPTTPPIPTPVEETASAPQPVPSASVELSVVHANIQTIKDVEPSFFNKEGHGQRRIYLTRQLIELDVHIALLQECRSKAGRWASHGFLSWRSGHVKGNLGVEVWVRPGCVHPPLQLDHWRICFSAPRLLIVRCLRADFPLTLVSGHAPHAERPPEEIRAFWTLFGEQLRRLRRDGTLVIGLDANADFLAQDEHHLLVGPTLAVRQGRSADDFLLQLVQELSLYAVGTWPELHSGPTWTWQHTSGKRQRLDHFLISCGTSASRHQQFPDFDILNGDNRDHMPLRCQLRVPCRVCHEKPPAGRYAADRASDVASAIWSMVQPRFDLSPSDQVSAFMQQHLAAVAALPRRPPFAKRQPYLSDEAATVLFELRDARAELRTLRTALTAATLRAVFTLWRGAAGTGTLRVYIHGLRLQIAHHQDVAFSLRVQAHALARRDKKAHFESLLTDATEHWHATGRVHDSANRLAWASKTARQKREVRAASGFDIDVDLQAQFQQQEAGRAVTATQLEAHFSAWQQHRREACPLALPTLLDLEALCRSQKGGKAPGPDHVRNEVWKSQPASAGRWFWPLCLRISGGHPEPIHFKDSAVCALHKKGPAHLPVNFRSIAMLNGVAKMWHSHVRATIGQEILRRYFPTQLGGRRGVDTGLALAIFRCAGDLADAQGRSWAAFFVDIQAAYYEADRDLLFHDASADETLLQLRLPAHVHGLITGGVLAGLGVPQSQIDLLRDCVECSFWTFTGQQQTIMATRGSRPGDGLADVLFGALFAVILNCIDHACRCDGLCHTSLHDALGVDPRPLQLAWADDLSLLVDFDSPGEALALLPRLATIILRTIEAFRFRVNLGPGKTEALVKLCGNGATAARTRLLSDPGGILAEDGRYIRVVPEYKYLGVPQRTNDSGRRDIEAAAGRGRAVWSQAANLIHSPSLPWPLKLAWLNGRTLPAAFSSLSTTVAVSARALSPLKGFYDQCLRQLASTWTDGHHVSSDTLQVCISAPDVDTSICVARVRLLCRLVQHRSSSAYDALVAAWDRAGRWATLLQQAVRRVWPGTRLPPLETGGPTIALVQRSTRPLLHACRRISRHGSLLQALCNIWTFFGRNHPRGTIGKALPCTCEDCGAVLPSRHALAAHMHRMHGRVALLTQYTLGPVCLWCLTDFHNTDRLKYHLLHSPACEHGLRCVVGPVYEYGSGSKRTGKKGHPRVPLCRIAGPLNASPAQRLAALEGRECSEQELLEELGRLSPGPSFSSSARSTNVIPRPQQEAPPSSAAIPSPVPPQGASCDALRPAPPLSTAFSEWRVFAEHAHPDDWIIPSISWHLAQPLCIWVMPVSWLRCLKLFQVISTGQPWSQAMWRHSSFLRREAAPHSSSRRHSSFESTSQVRRLFLCRLVTFRLLLQQVERGAAIWCSEPLSRAWESLFRQCAPSISFVSTISVLGFGTLLALSPAVDAALSLLSLSKPGNARLFRLASPHFHC